VGEPAITIRPNLAIISPLKGERKGGLEWKKGRKKGE
jgi:hypothetical protein